MKHGEKMLSCTLVGLALCTAANAATSESSGSPYLGIVERNVFGLKPPPPLPKPEDNKPPPPKIFLQGITTFGGVKRALFKAQMPPRPGEPAKGEQSFILAEGQRDGDIEVLEIDVTPPGSVKVNDFGTIITLDFEHNGIKTSAQTPVAAAAAQPQMSAQQRLLLAEAYRAKLKQQGLDRTVPPIPPTPLAEELNPPTSPAAQ